MPSTPRPHQSGTAPVCSIVSESFSPMDCSPLGISQARILDCHFLHQGIFSTQGSNPHLLCLLHWRVDSLPLGSLQFLSVWWNWAQVDNSGYLPISAPFTFITSAVPLLYRCTLLHCISLHCVLQILFFLNEVEVVTTPQWGSPEVPSFQPHLSHLSSSHSVSNFFIVVPLVVLVCDLWCYYYSSLKAQMLVSIS